MYKVRFVTRDHGSYAYETDVNEVYFQTETDANTFYDDLENFIEKAFEGMSYVESKSKPEKLNNITLCGYDPSIKRLYRID